MNQIIAIIVLLTFFPMQLFAFDAGGFSKDTQIDYFVPRDPDKAKENDQNLNDKILENSPTANGTNSGINWKLWGGVGLLAVVGGILAVVSSGSKGGSTSNSDGGQTSTTTTVTGSW